LLDDGLVMSTPHFESLFPFVFCGILTAV
jgi:hypothetical protein